MTRVYKVCSIRDGKFTSACTWDQMDEQNARATYAMGVKTLPPIAGSKLFAFTNFEDANDFACSFWSHMAIFEAVAENVEPVNIGYLPLPYDIISYWTTRIAPKNPSNGMYIPTGTVWCDSITPIEELHR